MDLTIDNIQQYAASEQLYLNLLAGCPNRYHVSRVCAHATVIQDPTTSMRVRQLRGVDLAMREAQEWQSDQDEDLDAAEVIHHLHQQAKSSTVMEEAISRTERSDAITTLVTSCSFQSPLRSASPRERPPSSFYRYSFRQSMITYRGRLPWTYSQSNIREFLPDAPADINLLWGTSTPKIVGEMSLRNEFYAVWHLQLDVVDLLSPRRLPTWCPGKRRRTTINPFHQVSAPPHQDAAPGNHPPEAKRFKGVRYRLNRRKWAAEMKPKNSKKVSFGEFNSQAQAARAIDAAFHYYDKPHLLNFPDTPGILTTRPLPAGVLDKEDKLRFVKEQVRWLAFIASTLPASPPSVPPPIPESPSRGCNGNTSLFHSISEISSFLSCGDADESDDGISQPLPSLHPDALSELAGSASMEPPFVGADFVGADFVGSIIGTLEEHQGMLDWSLEDALVAPSSSGCSSGWWSLGSSVQITHGWDVVGESSAPALINLTNSAEPSCESPGSWMNYLAMSPPASMLPLPPRSPISFHGDVTHGLLEKENYGREWLRG